MTLDNENSYHLFELPTEILLYIFTFLHPRDLIKSRQVCLRWKSIVDALARSDCVWRQHCKTDFTNVYKTARLNARPGLLWFNIYRSLSLWSRLDHAREQRDEFASASRLSEEIKNFKVLKNGIIGVHTRSNIVYYNIETLELSKRGSISGDYMSYAENDYSIAILNNNLELFVVRKNHPHITENIVFKEVKMFILVDKDVCYVNLSDEVHKCHLDENNMTDTFIKRTDDSIMSLGLTDRLHILTFQRNIYSMVNKTLEFTCYLDADTNLLHQLQRYNFLERLDWRVYFQWMYILNHSIPQGPLRDIVTVRSYGDVYFVGSNLGVLRIYYAPYSSGQLDIFNAEPVKQYNFMERRDCPVLSMCPIIQIDVLEAEDGHTVVVGMPKKIAVLNFLHNFKRSATVAMLPYDDVQKIKLLKIDSVN